MCKKYIKTVNIVTLLDNTRTLVSGLTFWVSWVTTRSVIGFWLKGIKSVHTIYLAFVFQYYFSYTPIKYRKFVRQPRYCLLSFSFIPFHSTIPCCSNLFGIIEQTVNAKQKEFNIWILF